MSWDAFVWRSPMLALILLGVLLVGSHLWNAARIIDQRRAELRKASPAARLYRVNAPHTDRRNPR